MRAGAARIVLLVAPPDLRVLLTSAVVQVGALYEYPVKSLRGVPATEADVERAGLRRDRRWMLVDDDGVVLTAREHHELLAFTATPDAAGGVVVSVPGRPPLAVPVPHDGATVSVRLSRLPYATAAGERADAWFSAAGLPARLVWLDDPDRRPVSPNHGGQVGDPLSLADAGPILLTTTSSLRQLNTWIAEHAANQGRAVEPPLAMARFRPNVVVDDDGDLAPFAEDRWSVVRIGDVELRFGEQCDRCVLTTIDPETLLTGKEPIRTLALHRRREGAVWFGVRLIPLAPGRIRVGDRVSAR